MYETQGVRPAFFYFPHPFKNMPTEESMFPKTLIFVLILKL